jgi:mitogen-activated protein kinase organizer 1
MLGSSCPGCFRTLSNGSGTRNSVNNLKYLAWKRPINVFNNICVCSPPFFFLHLHSLVMRAKVVDPPKNLPSAPKARLVGHEEGPIRAIKFTSDGKYCITAGHDRTVRLWNPLRIDPAYEHANPIPVPARSAMLLDSLPHALPIQTYSDGYTYPISAIDIDDTSTTLLSSSDKTLVVTDVLTRKVKKRFQGHTGRINSVACSSEGTIFLSASYDGTVRIWDGRSFSTSPVQTLTDARDSVSSVTVLEKKNDLCEIVTSSIDGKLRTYDVRRGLMNEDDLGKNVALTCFAHTSDNLCGVVSCLNGAIHVTERSTSTLLNTCFGGHTAGKYSLECQVTSDDQFVVSGSEDGSVVFYDFASGRVAQTLEGHGRATCTVAVHPSRENSSVVVSGSYDGNAVVWT